MIQLLSGHRLAIYQEDGDVVRDAKVIPELLFGQEIDGTLRLGASGSYTILAPLLAYTAYTGGIDAPSC